MLILQCIQQTIVVRIIIKEDIVLVFLSYVASRRKNLVEKHDGDRIEVIDVDVRET